MKEIVKAMFDLIKKTIRGIFEVIVFICKIWLTTFMALIFIILFIICFPFYLIYWLYRWSYDLDKYGYGCEEYTNLFKDYYIANTETFNGVENHPNAEIYNVIESMWEKK